MIPMCMFSNYTTPCGNFAGQFCLLKIRKVTFSAYDVFKILLLRLGPAVIMFGTFQKCNNK